jgi:hypothetical protein
MDIQNSWLYKRRHPGLEGDSKIAHHSNGPTRRSHLVY